jgi:hypothetical protein
LLVESFDVADPSEGLRLSGDTVSIAPSGGLDPGTTYYVEINGTAIEDLSGNPFEGFSGDGTWRFTTAAADETAPSVETLSPANGAGSVGLSSNLVVTFDEEVTFGTGTIRLRQSGGALVESFDVASPLPGLGLSGNTVTVDPSGDLDAATTYLIEIDSTAIEDLSGNRFAGISGGWSFTTADPSTILLFDFQNDQASDIATGAVAVDDLSSPVSADGITLTASVGNNLSSSRDRGANSGPFSDLTRDFIQWSISTPITLTISGLASDQEYRFRLWSGDLAGNQIKTTDHTIAGASGGGTVRHTSVSLADENASGGSLIEFPNVISTSAGTLIYTIDYVTGGGTAATLNGFELTAIRSSPPRNSFTAWAELGTLPGTVNFAGDLNGDGVADGLAFLLGVDHPDADATAALPVASEDGHGGLILIFNCLPVSDRGGAAIRIGHSSGLSGWAVTTTVIPDVDGTDPAGMVRYQIDPLSAFPLNRVTATIDGIAASAGKLFGRIHGSEE